MEKSFAVDFANDWISAWNSHDLIRILSHYSDDFEMASPMIVEIMANSSGVLKGKDAVGAYWAKALQMVPNLRFELMMVCAGVNSITIQYRGVGGRIAVEVFSFGLDRKVTKAHAHYEEK
ncbi:MAG: nuclear transport factor 2 family protein [Candidatus Omnitrophota bacterium]